MTKCIAPRIAMHQPIGILNINKPTGVTSRDVVNRIQGLVKPAKVGHAGTLDPLAGGVLAVCVGPATRLIQYIQQMQKTYIASFLLGQTSDSDDLEGEIHHSPGAIFPAEIELRRELARLVGQIEQVPPAYSAVKVKGRRAYRLARRGEAVDLAARSVRVDAIDLLQYSPPTMRARIQCGSGVYIRSIGRDLGEAVGCGALMSSLERTAIGCFEIERAVTLDQLTADQWERRLLPPRLAVSMLPALTLSAENLQRLASGMQVAEPDVAANQQYAVLCEDGQLAGVGTGREDGLLQPTINLGVSGSASPSPRQR